MTSINELCNIFWTTHPKTALVPMSRTFGNIESKLVGFTYIVFHTLMRTKFGARRIRTLTFSLVLMYNSDILLWWFSLWWTTRYLTQTVKITHFFFLALCFNSTIFREVFFYRFIYPKIITIIIISLNETHSITVHFWRYISCSDEKVRDFQTAYGCNIHLTIQFIIQLRFDILICKIKKMREFNRSKIQKKKNLHWIAVDLLLQNWNPSD